MDKTIFVLLDACQYEAASKYLGYLEHMIDYNKGAKYKVLGELPSLSKPMYATLFTGLPVCKHEDIPSRPKIFCKNDLG